VAILLRVYTLVFMILEINVHDADTVCCHDMLVTMKYQTWPKGVHILSLMRGGYFGVVPVSSARGNSRISYSVAGRTTMHSVFPEDQI
jgi:hypothetical protein